MMNKVTNLIKTGALAFGVLFTMYSCNSGPKNNSGSQSGDSMESSSAATMKPNENGPTDPQIASIAVTANQIDVDNGKLAEKKATNSDVKNFAKTMVRDHQSVIEKAVALAKKLGVTPDSSNSTTRSLLNQQKETKKTLSSKSGSDFDKAYIDHEVDYHKAVIDVVGNTLIPSCKNEDLKNLLKSAVPMFKEHLKDAERIQKELEK